MKNEIIKIEINKQDFYNLLRDSLTLSALECGGVDNWEWYGEAVSNFIEDYKLENGLKNSDIDDIEDIAEIQLNEFLNESI